MYKEYEDEELLYLIGENNESAYDILYEKYKPIISLKTKKYVNYGKKIGLEYNDLFQEGMVGLSEAIRSYKDNKDTKFSSFATMCIDRKLLSTLKRLGRQKHAILNDSCSLDTTLNKEGKPLLDFLFTLEDDPSSTLVGKEEIKDFYESIYDELSDFEKSVFDLKISGLDYKEISGLLNKSYKSVDGAIQRIKLKIKTMIDKENNK